MTRIPVFKHILGHWKVSDMGHRSQEHRTIGTLLSN